MKFTMRTLACAALAALTIIGCASNNEDIVFGNDASPCGQQTDCGQGGQPGTGGEGGTGGEPESSSSSTSIPVEQPGETSSSSSGSSIMSSPMFCGGKECADGEVCCYYRYDQSHEKDACSADVSCGSAPDVSVFSCNSPSDCPGKVCCATRENSEYTSISCQDSCNGPESYVMCQGEPSICPAHLSCLQSNSLGAGYSLCR